MAKKSQYHIGVVGAGVAGLFTSVVLSRVGFKVTLIEQSPFLAGKASISNEGWLHTSYHAIAIPGREIAVQVAWRTLYGYNKIIELAPEVVEDPNSRTFALIKSEESLDEAESRWLEARVPYRRVALDVFKRLEPRVNISEVKGIYEVTDRSINTPLLYSKLANVAERSGVRIWPSTEICAVRDNVATISSTVAGRPRQLIADLFVYTTGFGTKALFQRLFGIDLPLRLWQSHLLDFPRPRDMHHSVFFVEPREATLMHHGTWSIAGLNADQLSVEAPSFNPVEENIRLVKQALRRLIPDVDLTKARGRACIKVDREPELTDKSDLAQRDLVTGREGPFVRPSLNVSYGEPLPNTLFCLPGKMTEAPFLADLLADLIYTRFYGVHLTDRLVGYDVQKARHRNISQRSIDQYTFEEAVSQR
jgi:glycine/D-amino acid oxidase-like deaminating enzyme